jgi:hypothetical protein
MTYGFPVLPATNLNVEMANCAGKPGRCAGAHFGRLTRISPAATSSTATANAGVSGSPNTR